MKFKMLDGSIYEESNESWVKAIRVRKKEWMAGIKKEKLDFSWEKSFAEVVKRYFDSKTMPNKFGAIYPNGEKWEKNYKNHAELAPVIMYIQLRVILMGMMMSNLGGGKVIALEDNGSATEYPSGKKYKEVSKALKK